MIYTPIPADVEAVARECINVGIRVHRHLGPGFKRWSTNVHSAWSWIRVEWSSSAEKRILVPYKSWMIAGQKIDLIVEGKVLIELKAVPRLRKIHQQQTLSYLKATGLRLGLLMNFNTRLLRDGLKRIVL